MKMAKENNISRNGSSNQEYQQAAENEKWNMAIIEICGINENEMIMKSNECNGGAEKSAIEKWQYEMKQECKMKNEIIVKWREEGEKKMKMKE